jgi:4-oxalocrotonate tautomerase
MAAYVGNVLFAAVRLAHAEMIVAHYLKDAGGTCMPYVNIRITKDGATTEKKAELIRGVTGLLKDLLGKDPQTTVVIIDEVDTDNWGIGGITVTQRRNLIT